MRRLISVFIFMTVPLLGAAQPLVTVTGSVSGPVGGVYTYSYTIENDPLSTESVWEFWVYPTAPFWGISQIIDPVTGWIAWDFLTDYASYIQWFSTDPSYDIPPGGSLSGFSYQSAGPPGTIGYEVGGSDPTWGWSTGNYASGTTVGATPEPAAFLLLLTGIGGGLVYLRRKRS